MPHTDLSIPALLRARAAEHGDVTAYTFMDGVRTEPAAPKA